MRYEFSPTTSITLTLVALLFAILMVAVNGWVFSVLWGWFVVPVFAAPILSVTQSIGLALTVRMIAAGSGKKEEPSLFIFTSPFLALGVGYIIHLLLLTGKY